MEQSKIYIYNSQFLDLNKISVLLILNNKYFFEYSIMAPSLSGKSQSHREIRSREKREVSFAVPTQRTRSLTRDEARNRDEDDDVHFGPASRSVSAQRLTGRPSRADSRVKFALDTVDNSEPPPVPPARSKDHSISKVEGQVGNHVVRSSVAMDLPSSEVSVFFLFCIGFNSDTILEILYFNLVLISEILKWLLKCSLKTCSIKLARTIVNSNNNSFIFY